MFWDKLFGFAFGNKKDSAEVVKQDPSLSDPSQQILNNVIPDEDAISIAGSAGGHNVRLVNFGNNYSGEKQRIINYRTMAASPECKYAVEDITNESIISDEKIVVKIDFDKPLDEKLSKLLRAEFSTIMKLLNFKIDAYRQFRDWYIDGRAFYHLIIDKNNPIDGIKKINKLDAAKTQKIQEIETEIVNGDRFVKSVKEYFVYKDDEKLVNRQYNPINESEKIIQKDAIVHVTSGEVDAWGKTVSYLENGIKAHNQLRMMEDSLVIYRITRAPERRVFYVDTGDMPKTQAENYVKNLMNRHKTKMIYNAATGNMEGGYNHMAMTEDFWMPRINGGRGTEIDTLASGSNLSEIEDIEYFKKHLYRALNVPLSRLETENGFSLGRASEITRDELKFNKFIKRLQRKFSEIFTEILKKQCILKNIIKESEWAGIKSYINILYDTDVFFAELKDSEILSERVGLLRDFDDNREKGYYSKKWIQKHILKQTDDEIAEIKAELDAEKPEDGESNDDDSGNSNW